MFYVADNHLFDDTRYAYGEYTSERNQEVAVKCEECGSYLSMMRWLPPYEIKVSKTTLGDFIFGTFVKPIVSSRFKTLYEDAELKGITHFDPVKVYYQRQLLQVDFHHPEITLNSARVNILKSGLEFEGEQGCGRCQKAGRIIKRMNGLYFENENEIRDDIFNIKMIGAVVVSQNFKNFVERHTLSNISLVASKDYTAVSILGK